MDLNTYIAEPERRKALADACHTTGDWLYQVATNWNGRRASTDLAQLIERESERIGPERVPKETLRPDVWCEEQHAELRPDAFDGDGNLRQGSVHAPERAA